MTPTTRRGLLAAAMLLLVPVSAGAVAIGAARPELPADEAELVQRRRYRRIRTPRFRRRARLR